MYGGVNLWKFLRFARPASRFRPAILPISISKFGNDFGSSLWLMEYFQDLHLTHDSCLQRQFSEISQLRHDYKAVCASSVVGYYFSSCWPVRASLDLDYSRLRERWIAQARRSKGAFCSSYDRQISLASIATKKAHDAHVWIRLVDAGLQYF
jgi:hypothetical protein